MLSVLKRSLERAGHEVLATEHSREGLRMLKASPVDLLVTDIIMPDLEGIELILHLRQTQPSLRIIAISGGGQSSPDSYLALARRCGAAKVLAKPFPVTDLSDAVTEVLSA